MHIQGRFSNLEQARETQRRNSLKLQRKTGKRPNIVWIVVDDMGFGDPGCYGGGKAVGADTPVMDRLALEGLRLTSCYSQHTCTPTRSAILDRTPTGADWSYPTDSCW